MKYFLFFLSGFIAFLIIGLTIAPDYGMGYDDEAQRLIGKYNDDAMRGNSKPLLSFSDRYYGPAFELLLRRAERYSGAETSQDIYRIRHRISFVHFWISALIFFVMTAFLFRSWTQGALGSVFLVLSPRIFAESFYNTKDIPFLAACIMTYASFLLLLRKQHILTIILFSILAGYATAIRPFGLLFPVMFVTSELIRLLHVGKRGALMRMSAHIVTFCTVVLFLWPILRMEPMSQFMHMLKESAKPFDQPIFYLGSFISSASKPWHYLPVMMGVTIPPFVIFLFLVGMTAGAYGFARRTFSGYYRSSVISSLAIWVLIPISLVYVKNPRIYDGWRHLYFLYAPILLLAVFGYRRLEKAIQIPLGKMFLHAFTAGVIVTLLSFNITHHPYQYAYFNVLAGNLKQASERFDFDYWGLSEAEAIQFVLSHDPRPVIRIYFRDTPGLIYTQPERNLERIVPLTTEDHPDYLITQHRWMKEVSIPGYRNVHSITVNGAILSSIYTPSND